MENITSGHWIFAALFVVIFISGMIWSYRNDLKLHRIHYRGTWIILLVLIGGMFLIYLMKDFLR